MPTVHQPTVTGPLQEPDTTPYFLRCASVLRAVEAEQARRALLAA